MPKIRDSWKYNLSIGVIVLSPRHEQFVKMIKSMYKCLEFDIKYEFCIFLQVFDVEGKLKIEEEINKLKANNVIVNVISLEKNIGFSACWNCLVQTMEGEYHMMMQDDMEFANKPKEKLSDFIKFKNENNLDILNLNGCTAYTDWMHIEHSSLRTEIGDYKCYPRYYNSLKEQGTSFEHMFGDLMLKNNKKIGIFRKSLGGCQKTPDISYCHLLTKLGNLSEAEKEKIWEHPLLLKLLLNENNNK